MFIAFKVHNFALETGDLSTLSQVDVNVLALCRTMIAQKKKTHLLNKHPKKVKEYTPSKVDKKSDRQSGWGDWVTPSNIN